MVLWTRAACCRIDPHDRPVVRQVVLPAPPSQYAKATGSLIGGLTSASVPLRRSQAPSLRTRCCPGWCFGRNCYAGSRIWSGPALDEISILVGLVASVPSATAPPAGDRAGVAPGIMRVTSTTAPSVAAQRAVEYLPARAPHPLLVGSSSSSNTCGGGHRRASASGSFHRRRKVPAGCSSGDR